MFKDIVKTQFGKGILKQFWENMYFKSVLQDVVSECIMYTYCNIYTSGCTEQVAC